MRHLPRRRQPGRSGARRERAAVGRLIGSGAAALAAVALAGCGGAAETASPRASAAESLAQAADRLRAEGRFSFASSTVRTRADRPDDPETYATTEGAIDLRQGRGRVVLDLDLGLPSSGSASPLEDPITLRWNRTTVEAELGGEASRLPRERARASGGLIGRLPDESEALVELLELGSDARLLDDDHVGFDVDARKAGRAGAPAELSGAAAAGMLGATLPFEAWLDDEGRPRRIAYRIEQAPTAVLPARTVVVTYELSGFGDEVSGLEFTTQAG